MIQTKRWDEPWDREADGMRVLICRYRPRALPKKKESWHLWWSQLGPSKELHAAFYGKTGESISIEEYTRRYLEEMQKKEAQDCIDILAEEAVKGKTITLLCSSACTDPQPLPPHSAQATDRGARGPAPGSGDRVTGKKEIQPMRWTAVAILPCLACLPASVQAEAKPTPLTAGARTVLAAVVKAARDNASQPARLRKDGDELTVLYVRAAAAAASKLPGGQAAGSFLVALGVGLDDSTLVRNNPLLARLWREVESDAERQARLKVLGKPTLRHRHDWTQHFVVSCGLTEVVGPALAEAAGLLKEQLDAQPGGSGFSFADLSADLAGIAFATRIKKGDLSLEKVGAASKSRSICLIRWGCARDCRPSSSARITAQCKMNASRRSWPASASGSKTCTRNDVLSPDGRSLSNGSLRTRLSV